MFNIIKLNAIDNVAVAPMNIALGSIITSELKAETNIPFGHKISLQNINKGDLIYKYGQIIGIASEKINKGSHVHSHDLTKKIKLVKILIIKMIDSLMDIKEKVGM